jgi:hypothetical protein
VAIINVDLSGVGDNITSRSPGYGGLNFEDGDKPDDKADNSKEIANSLEELVPVLEISTSSSAEFMSFHFFRTVITNEWIRV